MARYAVGRRDTTARRLVPGRHLPSTTTTFATCSIASGFHAATNAAGRDLTKSHQNTSHGAKSSPRVAEAVLGEAACRPDKEGQRST